MGLFPKDRDLSLAPDRVELEVRASDFQLRPSEVRMRLDAFLAQHLSWRSRNSIQTLIRDGFVLVAAPCPERPGELDSPRPEKRASRTLRHGTKVVVVIPEELRLPQLDTDVDELNVLFEDDEVVVVDKPARMPVHPSGRHMAGTLIQRLHARYRAQLGLDEKPSHVPVRLCHRLDRETSGLVLCGKGAGAHRHLMIQFEKRRIEKEYLALVHGSPEQDEGRVELPLGPALASAVHLKIAVREDGQPSTTTWRVLERRGPFSLVSCTPLTGRQHQIRVHMEAIGHPLVGDKLYGLDEGIFLRSAADELTERDREELILERHGLHNHRLAFTKPGTGERVEVVSPLATDLAELFYSG